MSQFAYDIETYPNTFIFVAIHMWSDAVRRFEMSEYRDDSADFLDFMHVVTHNDLEGVGFNNLGFDYPVVHHLLNNRS